MKTIEAFGKMVDRERAIEIICNDRVCEICYARMENELRSLLIYGWRALDEWSDKELESYIAGLCPQNQPDYDGEPISWRPVDQSEPV